MAPCGEACLPSEETKPLSVVFTTSVMPDAENFNKLVHLTWPADFVDSVTGQTHFYSVLAHLYENLFTALRKKQCDHVLQILTSDPSPDTEGNQLNLTESSLEVQVKSLNGELGHKVVTIVDSVNLLISVTLDRHSDPKMTIRKALLDHRHKLTVQRMREEEEASQLESINSESLGGENLDDLQEHKADKIQHSEAEYRSLAPTYVSPPQPCYFPTQEYMGDLILDRIQVILYHYHKGKTLDQFKRFEYQIYTFNSAMLEQQTIKRLCNPQAECFPAKLFTKSRASVVAEGQRRVHKYNIQSHEVVERHKELVRMAEKEPQTLFLIVADEAHWGITSDETSVNKKTANNLLVNSWDDGKHPNVIVLQVTATPFNLLTDCTRIVKDKIYARHKKTNEPIMLTDNKGTRCFSADTGKDVTDEVSSYHNLHHVKWSESFEAKLQVGVRARLKIALDRGDGFAWMCVGKTANRHGGFHLKGTDELDDAVPDELKVKGDLRKVRITSSDGALTLGVLETAKASGYGKECDLCFMDEETKTTFGGSFHEDFTVHCRFGQDVFELEGTKVGAKEMYLYYDALKREVALGRAPHTEKHPSFEISPPSYTFLIDSLNSGDDTKSEKEYLALNYFFNTMRNSGNERLLRGDRHFADMCSKIKKEYPKYVQDDILAAEYSYYILIGRCSQGLDDKLQECMQKEMHGEATRQVIGNYSRDLQNMFESFQSLLREDQGQGRNFKPILPEVFAVVHRYLQTEATVKFEKEKRRRRLQMEDFCSCLRQLVVHGFSPSEIDRLADGVKICDGKDGKPTVWTSVLLNEEDPNQDDSSILDDIRMESETFAIAKDLLSAKTDGKGLHGHLKIVRLSQGREKAQQAAAGNRIYATLCLVRKVAAQNNEYLFEILRDYDNFKLRDQMKDVDDPDESVAVGRIRRVLQPMDCQYCDPKTHESCSCDTYTPNLPSLRCARCSHLHKDITEYSDLDRLPCILILDRKGRMGDTFPPSFNVMDLRLNFVSQSMVFLSSVMQDLGRMCRYMQKDGSQEPPYALIGPFLEKIFMESLQKCGVFFGIISHRHCKEDKYVIMDKKANTLKAAKHSYDVGNTKKHRNRLLLEAEPQVGKTGVFLNVISKLRKHIEERDGNDDKVTFESCPEDEEQMDVAPQNEVQSLDASYWQYPFWKSMTEAPAISTKVGDSKYARVFGSYEYGKRPQALKKSDGQSRKPKAAAPIDDQVFGRQYRAFSAKAHRCSRCLRETIPSVFTITVAGEQVKISVPNSRRFIPLFDRLGMDTGGASQIEDSMLGSQRSNSAVGKDKPILKSWIFMPSYRRVMDGNINLAHTMVDVEGDTVDYVQVLVVRSEEFKTYCERWQSTHAVLQLPDRLQLPDGDGEANANEGGIGFSRLFIQLFSEDLHLEHIFVADDNIPLLYEVVQEDQSGKEVIVRDADRNVGLKNSSMFRVLSDLESRLDHHPVAPKPPGNFPTFCESAGQGDDCCGLHSFTAPPTQYAIAGITKARPTVKKMVNPFRRTHVYSLVLLNIELLKEQGIRYNPWPVFEDCTINNDCDTNGLWVCKYSKFVMAKTHLKTWMPTVYEWPPETSLATANRTNRDAEDWVDPLVQWLKCNAPPKRLDVLPDLGPQEVTHLGEQMADLTGKIRQVRVGKDLSIVLHDQSPELADVTSVLQRFYSETPGIGGFQKHAIFVPIPICLRRGLLTAADFEKKIIRPCFGETDFKVITSHNIHQFRVPLLLLYVEGRAQFASDQDVIGNIGTKVHVPKTNRSSGNNGEKKGEDTLRTPRPHDAGSQEVDMEVDERESDGKAVPLSHSEQQGASLSQNSQLVTDGGSRNSQSSELNVNSQGHLPSSPSELTLSPSKNTAFVFDWGCDNPDYIPDDVLYAYVSRIEAELGLSASHIRQSIPSSQRGSQVLDTTMEAEDSDSSTDSEGSLLAVSLRTIDAARGGRNPSEDFLTESEASNQSQSILCRGTQPTSGVDSVYVSSDEVSDAESESLLPTVEDVSMKTNPNSATPGTPNTSVKRSLKRKSPYSLQSQSKRENQNQTPEAETDDNGKLAWDLNGDQPSAACAQIDYQVTEAPSSSSRVAGRMPEAPSTSWAVDQLVQASALSVSVVARMPQTPASSSQAGGGPMPQASTSSGLAVSQSSQMPVMSSQMSQADADTQIDPSGLTIYNQRSRKRKELKRGQTLRATDVVDLGANSESWLSKDSMKKVISSYNMKKS